MRIIKHKYIILIALVCTLSCGASWAAVGGSSGVEFLKLKGGARPLAMGNAYSALADDASAVFFNPAGLSQVNFPEVMSMQNNWFLDMTHLAASVVVPTNLGVMGVSYSGITSGDIQGYDASGSATSTFNTDSSCLAISLGRQINQKLSLGVGVKSISERLENNSASSFAVDAGLLYRVGPNVKLGISALNVGTGYEFISTNTPLPTSYLVGVALNAKMFDEDITITSDYDITADGAKLNFGAEYLMKNFLALRVGSSGGLMHSGLGISANLFAFDYAYFQQTYLGPTHQLSISILFGAAERSKEIIIRNMALGKAYLKEGKFVSAIVRFESVLDLDPKNQEARDLLRNAEVELEREAFARVFAEKEVEKERTVAEVISSGKSFLADGKHLEALSEFAKVLAIDPTNREALKLQSEAQLKMETKLIKRTKNEAKAYLGDAMKFVVTGDYKQALEKVDLALEMDPRNQESLELKKKLELILKIEKK